MGRKFLHVRRIALASYDFHSHVPSEFTARNLFKNQDNIKSQGYMENLVIQYLTKPKQ